MTMSLQLDFRPCHGLPAPRSEHERARITRPLVAERRVETTCLRPNVIIVAAVFACPLHWEK